MKVVLSWRSKLEAGSPLSAPPVGRLPVLRSLPGWAAVLAPLLGFHRRHFPAIIHLHSVNYCDALPQHNPGRAPVRPFPWGVFPCCTSHASPPSAKQRGVSGGGPALGDTDWQLAAKRGVCVQPARQARTIRANVQVGVELAARTARAVVECRSPTGACQKALKGRLLCCQGGLHRTARLRLVATASWGQARHILTAARGAQRGAPESDELAVLELAVPQCVALQCAVPGAEGASVASCDRHPRATRAIGWAWVSYGGER